jgi:hypothetical protein
MLPTTAAFAERLDRPLRAVKVIERRPVDGKIARHLI